MNSNFHNYLPQKLKHIFTVENDFKILKTSMTTTLDPQ